MNKPNVWNAGVACVVLMLAAVLLAGCRHAQAGPSESTGRPAAVAPHGLRVGLYAHPERVRIHDARPTFSWGVPLTVQGDVQTAWQLQVGSDAGRLAANPADVWDSGRMDGPESTAVRYGGPALAGGAALAWRVRTWNVDGEVSGWSAPQAFRMAETLLAEGAGRGRIDAALPVDFTLAGYPLEEMLAPPVEVRPADDGSLWVDFGRHAFGTLVFELDADVTRAGVATVRLGEKLNAAGAIDREPGGTIRFREVPVALEPGTRRYRVVLPADQRNTGPKAIPIPAEHGVIMPFRYAEIVMPPSTDAAPVRMRQVRVEYPFDDDAAAFACSDPVLNAVWELCRYSMKATSFAGIYVDGDRERIPYEADAHLNQLSHYAVDAEFTLARRSHEYLMQRPTWPTEWPLHSVLMAGADYDHTGDLDSVRAFYQQLQAKTLHALARDDGLISTEDGRVTPELLASIDGKRLKDIVDWPAGERDDYDLRPYNTVVNAVHHGALRAMGRLAAATGHAADAARFTGLAERHAASFNRVFFDADTGAYLDGEGSTHRSLHASLFALAFGLVPDEHRPGVVAYVKSRGMACSVYPAQYLLETMCRFGEVDYALELMTNDSDRGWVNMMRVGSTITLEAWDAKYKPNLDWNHAWGAAPGNIVARFILGVTPEAPGFARARVAPQPGTLTWMKGTVPTIRGAVGVSYAETKEGYTLEVRLPANVPATLVLPGEVSDATLNGEAVELADGQQIDLSGGGVWSVVVQTR